MKPHTPQGQRAHPELASMLALLAQLELLPAVLGAVHTSESQSALADQARSISRVAKVMGDQIRACARLLEDDGETKRQRS